MLNIPTSLNKLKSKVNDSDAGKLKAVPVELKKRDAVSNTKTSEHENKTPDILNILLLKNLIS